MSESCGFSPTDLLTPSRRFGTSGRVFDIAFLGVLMVTSRYAELVEPGKLVIKEEELAFNDDQLLIRITHCGLCQYDGVYYKGIIGQTPMRLGHEPVGVVEAVGRNVKGFKPGDRVTGLFAYLRAFATYGVAEPHQLLKVPENVPSEQALGEPLRGCLELEALWKR